MTLPIWKYCTCARTWYLQFYADRRILVNFSGFRAAGLPEHSLELNIEILVDFEDEVAAKPEGNHLLAYAFPYPENPLIAKYEFYLFDTINANLRLKRVNKVQISKSVKLRAFKHAEDKWRAQ